MKNIIKVIKNSDLDNERLSQIQTPIDNTLKDFDFSNLVVEKPWGYEYLLYQNKDVSIWILHIKHNCLTSMHCHLNKKTALIVLSGEAVFTTLEEGLNLKPGDALILDKKVFHSTQSLSPEGLIMMEVETPSEKTDLLRLSDDYGRQSIGYEPKSSMSENFSSYNCISFKEEEYNVKKRIKNMDLSLEKFNGFEKFNNDFKNLKMSIILNGKLINDNNGEIFSIGDILDFSNLKKENNNFILSEHLEILNIEKNDQH